MTAAIFCAALAAIISVGGWIAIRLVDDYRAEQHDLAALILVPIDRGDQ